MQIFDFTHAIARLPSRSVVDGLSVAGVRPSFDGIAREHDAYVHALEDAGIAVELLPALEAYPDSIFIEDAALVFSQGAILLKPGAPTRAGEIAEIAPALARRFDSVLHLEGGVVDGGDVLATPRGVFIGRSTRTNEEGANALVALLGQIGLRGLVVTTPPGVLHLKSDCSLLDGDTILSTARLAASGVFAGFRLVIAASGEEGAANAVRLNDRVLLSDAFPRTADFVSRAGYRIVALPTREIAKIDAGLSCMSLRWHS